MNLAEKAKFSVLFVLFLGGLYYYGKYGGGMEGFSGDKKRCPNLLIQKDAKYYLYNTSLAEVPGVNPIMFNNLEEYTEFLEWQRSNGIRCPVLYVQNTYDAQGNRLYKVRPSVTELQGGLPPVSPPMKFTEDLEVENLNATNPNNPNRQELSDNNLYPAYNADKVSSTAPIDQIKNSDYNMLYSDNAMDPNWGGHSYTQNLLDSGHYKGNEVNIKV